MEKQEQEVQVNAEVEAEVEKMIAEMRAEGKTDEEILDVFEEMDQEEIDPELDAQIDAIIEEMRADGKSDEEILAAFAEVEDEVEDEAVTEGMINSIVEAVNNEKPADLADMFDAAIKAELSGIIEDRKLALAASMFVPAEAEETSEVDTEDANPKA
jgi:uncharacterized protein (DUF433 family)